MILWPLPSREEASGAAGQGERSVCGGGVSQRCHGAALTAACSNRALWPLPIREEVSGAAGQGRRRGPLPIREGVRVAATVWRMPTPWPVPLLFLPRGLANTAALSQAVQQPHR